MLDVFPTELFPLGRRFLPPYTQKSTPEDIRTPGVNQISVVLVFVLHNHFISIEMPIYRRFVHPTQPHKLLYTECPRGERQLVRVADRRNVVLRGLHLFWIFHLLCTPQSSAFNCLQLKAELNQIFVNSSKHERRISERSHSTL